MAQYAIQTERLSRLFNILSQLSPHSQVTVHDLAVEYSVNERTIQRDIEVLERAELGIFADDENRIRMGRNGYKKIQSWMSA